MGEITLVVIFFVILLFTGSALSLYWTYRSTRRQQREREIQRTTRQRIKQIVQQQ